jgi:hypothetical protein
LSQIIIWNDDANSPRWRLHYCYHRYRCNHKRLACASRDNPDLLFLSCKTS